MTPVELVAGLAAFSLAVLLLCSVLPVWLELRRPHRTRRGGYLKPHASAPTRAGGQPTPATGTTAPISSSSPRGTATAVADSHQPLAPLNRLIVLSSYGSETGAAGASGARALAKRVGSDDD